MHYHTQKQRETKIEPRIKLQHSKYTPPADVVISAVVYPEESRPFSNQHRGIYRRFADLLRFVGSIHREPRMYSEILKLCSSGFPLQRGSPRRQFKSLPAAWDVRDKRKRFSLSE